MTGGAARPVLTALFASAEKVTGATTAGAVTGRCRTGAMAARAGGAPPLRGAVRVMFWGALAMAAAAGIGKLLGAHLS